jgi:hypothetical protein
MCHCTRDIELFTTFGSWTHPGATSIKLNSIQFMSHSIDPLRGVNHKDVESVIQYNNIYKIQRYSWIMYKSKDIIINNIVSMIIYYYTFAVSKVDNSIIIPNIQDKKLQ